MKINRVNYQQKHCYAVIALLCAFIFPYIASAQTDTSKKLNEVKISSIPAPKVGTITPAQQITADDFVHYSAFNIADAIRNFAGVNIKDYGGIGGLKTVSVRGLGANHTGVLYDGVLINEVENGQADLGKLNLNNIQEITLYNGQPSDICQPASSYAYSSVLSIKTIKPNLTADKPYLITAGVKAGSFGLFNPYLQWQQRLSNTWSFNVNSFLENANGRYKYKTQGNEGDSVRTRTNADINAQQVDGALYWAKNDSNKFNLHIDYYNSDRGLPGAVISYVPTASLSRLWNRDFFTQAGYERTWNNGVHLLLNTKISQDYLHYLDPNFLSENGKLDQQFKQREFYLSPALAYHLTTNWEISYAVDFSVNDLDINNDPPNINILKVTHPTRYTLHNVLASNLNLGKLRLQGSLLNTDISETVRTGTPTPNRNNFSPTLLATLLPFENSNFQVRSFYKYIFRNPTFDDLYYGGLGNPNLKPEYTNQYDLGITYGKNLEGVFEYITFTADAYYNAVKNKIVFIPKDTYNGSIQNFGNVEIKGLDAGLKTRINIAAGWEGSLSANYTYQQVINVTDPTSTIYLNQLPYTPKNTVALNAGVDDGHFALYYNQVISSSRYYTNDNLAYDYLPSYSVSDASIIYKFLTQKKPIQASVEVNNLFDKSYTIVNNYPMPGRSYRLTLQITI